MGDLGEKQIELKVHGLTSEDHGRVPARVFANKLKQLVGALEAADAIANGKIVHTYILSSMHMSEPTAVLAEVPMYSGAPEIGSAIPVFGEAIESIKSQDGGIIALAPVVRKIGLLTSGAESKFSFAEIRTSSRNIIRIDDFLRQRANIARKEAPGSWFSGSVIGSFDGRLEYVDARGALPQIKLTLTAGGKEIDCVCRQEDMEALGDGLKKRVRIMGRAIYEANSPLPIRVEVTSISKVPDPADFSRWRGSFAPFEESSWEHDA